MKFKLQTKEPGESKQSYTIKVFFRYYHAWLQNLIKQYSNKNCMGLAKKERCRPMGSNQRPRY